MGGPERQHVEAALTGAARVGATDHESAQSDSRYVSSVFGIALRNTRQWCRTSVLAVAEEVALSEFTRWLARHRSGAARHPAAAVAYWIARKALAVACGRRRGDRAALPIPRAAGLDALVNAQNSVREVEGHSLAPVGDDHVTRAVLDLPDHRDVENAVAEALDAQNEVQQLPEGDWQADLHLLMKSRGWSLGEVAAALVVSRSAVARWRDGLGRPSAGRRGILRGLAESGRPPPRPCPKARPVVAPGAVQHRARLAELRAAGWTMEALGRALKVDKGTVYRWCAGDHPPRASSLAALAALPDDPPARPPTASAHAGDSDSGRSHSKVEWWTTPSLSTRPP